MTHFDLAEFFFVVVLPVNELMHYELTVQYSAQLTV